MRASDFKFFTDGGNPFGLHFAQIRLCTLFGIPVYLRPSLIFLLLIFATGGGFVTGIIYAALLLASIVAHELAHALVARKFGCPTRDISLSLLGGCASLVDLPRKPSQEFLVAVAGPAMSFLCGGAAFLLLCAAAKSGGAEGVARYIFDAFTGADIWVGEHRGVRMFYSEQFGVPAYLAVRDGAMAIFEALLYACCSNLMLGAFNLLPGFPMDGGRVFRSIAAKFTTRVRATWYAMMVGRGTAIMLGIIGAYRILAGTTWGFVTCLIAFMIWQVGYREYLMVLAEEQGGWSHAHVSPPPYGGDGGDVHVHRQ